MNHKELGNNDYQVDYFYTWKWRRYKMGNIEKTLWVAS